MWVDQVATRVHEAALSVNEVAICVLFKDRLREWAHFEVTRDIIDVKLGEQEELGEFAVLEVIVLENFPAFAVNDVPVFVDEVALLIDSAANVVGQDACAASLRDNVAVSVLVEDSNNIFHIEALPAIVEQFLDIAVI